MRYLLRCLAALGLGAFFLSVAGCDDTSLGDGSPDGVFRPPPPVDPRCDDGMRNGDESHVDCGGPECDPCEDGLGCNEASDCQSGVCASGFCLIPTCTDEVANGSETDVDCGGDCGPCEGGQRCTADNECISGVCVAEDESMPEVRTCLPTSCMDGLKNSDESDIDCGGSCPGCGPGADCDDAEDCASLNCVGGTCLAASCEDGVRNQDETDIDCGGDVCDARCDDTLSCDDDTDCANEVCSFNTCISCQDGFQNGGETDRDCGGPDCGPCPTGLGCREDVDCVTGSCEEFVCISCQDLIQNGDETDVDCGGGDPAVDPPESLCPRCLDRKTCAVDSDCFNGDCSDEGRCISCSDARKNGTETDIDCGGPGCAPCPDRFVCVAGTDCMSGRCEASLCISCNDGLFNGDETDLDCGGPDCTPCPGGLACDGNDDCASFLCDDGTCTFPDCGDGVKNGRETDVDCGGPACGPCDDGEGCAEGTDCVNGVCGADELCAEPTCDDGVANGDETDLDCGGPDCDGCADGLACNSPSDCETGACTFSVCGTDPCTAVTPGPTSDYDVCDFNTPATDVIEDISGSTTATELILTDDGNVRVSLPFDFEFYGTDYSQVYVNANGGIAFGTASAALNSSNAGLPTGTAPTILLAAFWDALDPTATAAGVTSGVWYETKGSSPNRRFIVQYRVHHEDVTTPDATSVSDIRIELEETTDEITVHYVDTEFGLGTLDDGLSATAGINSAGGRDGFEYSFGTADLDSGLVVRYTPRP